MVVQNIWTVEEILEYLREYSATIILKDGSPFVAIPKWPVNRWNRPVDRRKIVNEIVVHLKARKREILEWCAEQEDDSLKRANEARRKLEREREKADALRSKVQAACDANKEERARIIAGLREKAHASGRRLWWFVTLPRKPQMDGTGLNTVPDEATFAAIEGDGLWAPLPKIVPDPEPKRTNRAREVAWTGG